MKEDVLLLDFEGVYLFQPRLLERSKHLDLRHLRSVKYMCDQTTLTLVGKLVERAKVVFLGDSAYHHFSYIFLTLIDTPFELVVFDNHRDDMRKNSTLLPCDGWIRVAKKLRNLEAVHIVRRKNDLPKCLEHPIYLSIDKDVLSDRFLKLGWDQGTMKPEELLEAVKLLCKEFEIVGVDISGEPRDALQMKRSEDINLELLTIILKHSYGESLSLKPSLHDRRV
ncbi:MAG: Uncharacterized protein XD58_0885 [Thermotoga sp. 50_1627]|nr:MAG: Uncharacterized protein XD45_1180 [Thermotoga sp. 50_64]KUK25162.1 MAG: Uncharacterized protein XD58_0885 [Thermotoga sp. 50_1627]HBT38537.1 hypothetical protein [Pseudothermotoga sp.]HCO97635.1 hypothetical protein [Pseudothermotoga sp.]